MLHVYFARLRYRFPAAMGASSRSSLHLERQKSVPVNPSGIPVYILYI